MRLRKYLKKSVNFDIAYRIPKIKSALSVPGIEGSSIFQQMSGNLPCLSQALIFRSSLQSTEARVQVTPSSSSNPGKYSSKIFQGPKATLELLDYFKLILSEDKKIDFLHLKKKNYRVIPIRLQSGKSRESLTFFSPLLPANQESKKTIEKIQMFLSFKQGIKGTSGMLISRLLPVTLKKRRNNYRSFLQEESH